MELLINHIPFSALYLGDEKYLLQAHKKNLGIQLPMIGEYIQLKMQEKIVNVIACETELLIYTNLSQKDLVSALRSIEIEKTLIEKAIKFIEIDFNKGLDWDFAIDHLRLSKKEIIEQLISLTFTFEMYGFKPGFMYLAGLPNHLQLQRKSVPRISVPSGSLALGGKYLGIYGSSSPGGWNIIGQTNYQLSTDFTIEDFPSIGQQVKLINL